MEELETAKSDNNFSSIIFRKFKMNIEQLCYENFYKQKNTQLIINENIKEQQGPRIFTLTGRITAKHTLNIVGKK